MPTRPPSGCRMPGCPGLAYGPRAYCSAHDPGAWAGTRPMSPGWGRARRDCLARADHRCADCRMLATEVDHIRPRVEGGTDEPGNLRALCRDCHRKRTAAQSAAGRARHLP